MNTILFLVFMLPGTFFLGMYDVLTKRLLRNGISPSLLLGTVYSWSGAFLMMICWIVGLPELKPGFWPAMIATSSINLLSQFIWMKAFELEEASLVAPFRMITPPFVLFTGFLFLNETPSWAGAIGVIITMVGFWILIHGENKRNNTEWKHMLQRKGVVYAILGGLLFGITFPLDKKALLASSTLFFAAMTYLSVGLVYLSYNLIMNKNTLKILNKEKKHILPFVVTHTIAGLLTFQALNYTLAAYAAGAKRLGPVWTVILSGSFLKEKYIGQKLVATSIMLVGIIISLVF